MFLPYTSYKDSDGENELLVCNCSTEGIELQLNENEGPISENDLEVSHKQDGNKIRYINV